MKKIFLLIILGSVVPLWSSPETPDVISEHAVDQGSTGGPNEESPFLIERQDAKLAAVKAAESTTSINTLFPPRHSISQQMGHFFKNLISIAKSASSKIPSLNLMVEPAHFSIANNPELNITFKITNDKKDLTMLTFPTSQRLEMIIKDAHGNIISRWSDNHSFELNEDVVTINPKESILYTEKMATSMMKDGETYTLEVALANHPEYTLSQQLNPQQDVSDRSFLNETEQSVFKK